MAKLVIEVPEELRGLGEAFATMVARVQGPVAGTRGGTAVDYGQVEQTIAEEAGGIELAAHRTILEALDVDVPTVIIGGLRYTKVGRCEAPYHTLAGSVSIERSLDRQSGQRGGHPGGRVVDPVSLRAGVVEQGWLPRTAQVMAHQVQQGPSRDAVATAGEYGRLPYSRSSVERVAHLVGALAVADRQDSEDVLIDTFEVPSEARSVSVSLDRVSVPMAEPRPRPVGRPRKGAPKRPVARTFRMAYCGTVTLHDAQGEALHTIRYGCMPEGDVLGMRDRLVLDTAAVMHKRPLELALLCDGAPEMWGLLDEWFTAEHFGDPIQRLVDFRHVLEKLSAAARVLDGPAQAPTRVNRWRLALLNRRPAATEILAELVASGLDEGPGADHPVHAAITSLRSNTEAADRLNYARARRRGLPLGSGNVAATCKSLFELRLKRCGSRGKNASGQHIVQLRALALSNRWGPAVELTLRPLRKAVRVA